MKTEQEGREQERKKEKEGGMRSTQSRRTTNGESIAALLESGCRGVPRPKS